MNSRSKYPEWRKRFCIPLLGAAMVLASGCTRRIYVPAESRETRADTVREWHWSRDTVIQKDSVSVFRSGDTLRIERIRELNKTSTLRDTVFMTRTDSIRIMRPYPADNDPTGKRKEGMSKFKLAIRLAIALLAILLIIRIRKEAT